MSAAPSAPVLSSATGPRIGWAYAVASGLSALTLLALMNPEFGLQVRAWPWSLPGPRRWDNTTATVFVLGVCTLSFLAGCLLSPGRGRGIGMLVPAWLAICAFTNVHPDSERTTAVAVKNNLFGVAPFVAPVLAGLVAGGLFATLRAGAARGVGRGVAVVAASALGAILVYPQYVRPEEAAAVGGTAYLSPLTGLVQFVAAEGVSAVFSERMQGNARIYAVLVVLYTALALVGIAGAFFGARRGIAYGAIALFLLTLAYPLGYGLIVGWFYPAEPYDPAWLVGVNIAARQTFYLHMAAALAVFACTTDLVRGKAPRGGDLAAR